MASTKQVESSISAEEKQLFRIFSSDYSFMIPSYQRPYSWKTEMAVQLLEDISSFALKKADFDSLQVYFLGSLVVIKQPDKTKADVVDGQQRLTTLTILLSCLRDVLTNNDLKAEIKDLLYEKGSVTKGTEDSYRLQLRERDQEFFNQLIQLGNTDVVPLSEKADSQWRIKKNRDILTEKLNAYSQEDLKTLLVYLTRKCYLVVVSTVNEDSAFRIFNVLNDRGMQLSHADILKSEIIGAIDNDVDRNAYTEKWENVESFLGLDKFADLFGHIRMIRAKKKAKESILKEIREYVRPSESPKRFIDEQLIPYADAYSKILRSDYLAPRLAEQINNKLDSLKRTKNSDWVPPTILYMATHKQEPEKILSFLNKLDSCVLGMEVMGYYLNSRLEVYSVLLAQIEEEKTTQVLDFSESEVIKLKSILLGSDVYVNRYIKNLLLKIDEYKSEQIAKYNSDSVTVEHVLPQNPATSSNWVSDFSDEEREQLTNCLGNLLLLSDKKNPSARNYDFKVKKEKYFTAMNSTNFALTNAVILEQEWKPKTIKKRREEMANTVFQILGIDVSETVAD